MTWKEFDDLFQEFYEGEKKILDSKGKDYTPNSRDRLENFKSIAKITGTSPEQVALIYFLKHVFALASLVENIDDEGYQPGEPRGLRIQDIRNYALLIEGLFRDREKTPKPKSESR